ncbi:hypothetical protein [Fodinicola feengrottensis]|nr:hypothetical protein [Fodinicola feengrottensis]
MSCAPLDYGCAAARKRAPNNTGIDNDRRMVPYDTDHDPTTKASSTSRLEGSGQVLYAGLFWSSWARPGGNVPAAQVTGPSGRRLAITPDLVDGQAGPSAFQAYADVTNTVRSGGFGNWTVGWRTAPQSSLGGYAGWALIVVTSDATAPNGQVAVFDTNIGLGTGGHRSATIDLPLDMTGSASQVGVVGWEGDPGLTGDRLTINGHSLSPSDTRCSANDAFCSHADGAVEASSGRNWNTFGTDAWTASGGRLSRTSDLVGRSSADAVTLGAFAVLNRS